MGAVGEDGQFLEEILDKSGVDTSNILHVDGSSGHAIIQVNAEGQNCIVIFGGANRRLTADYVRKGLDKGEKGDYVLLQNETSETGTIISEAAARGMKVVFNPSPLTEDIEKLPLDKVSVFILNEIEGAQLSGVSAESSYSEILDALCRRYPKAEMVLTLGSQGVICRVDGKDYTHGIFKVRSVDTTAAGDTFCGYYLAGRCAGLDIPETLKRASAASAIAVSRAGAAPSIPTAAEVDEFLEKQ